jgi:hypothetical protein
MGSSIDQPYEQGFRPNLLPSLSADGRETRVEMCFPSIGAPNGISFRRSLKGYAIMKAFIRPCAFHSVWIIMTVAGVPATTDCARAQHEIFDESVIQKWKDYEAFSHSLQGAARSRETRNGKQREYDYRYKQNRDCAIFIQSIVSDPSFLNCTLANPHYSATIKLSKSDPSNAVLRKYTPHPSDNEVISAIDGVYIQASRHFYYSGTISLRQAVSDPSFKVTNVAKETQHNQELVRVDHIYNHVFHRPNNDLHTRTQGSLWLDPSRCWCIRRFKASDESTINGERVSELERDLVCETVDHPSGFPILKSITDTIKATNLKNHQKNDMIKKTDYELEVNDRVPDSEFTLSAFGLPEPTGMEPVKKPIPIYLWILLAAGVCGALAIAFRSLARRKHLADTA